MDILNSLKETIKTHDVFSLWIIVIVIMATILWHFPKYKHKRYLYRIIILGILLGIVGTYLFLSSFYWWKLILILGLWTIALNIALHSATKPIFPVTVALCRLENLLHEGRYTEIEKKYPRRPFYILNRSSKIKWDLLIIQKFIYQEHPRLTDAYKVCANLLKVPLFDNERDVVRIRQVDFLLQLGDTPKAKYIFEIIKQEKNAEKYQSMLDLQSFFHEKEGEFDKARQDLLTAIGIYDDKLDAQLATIYNNLGWMEKVRRNITDSSFYYRKSLKLTDTLQDKHLFHRIYQSVIFVYLMYNDKKNATEYLNKYESHIDKDNIDDLLRFNNFMLEYARKTQDRNLFLEIMDKGRVEILPRIPHNEQMIFEISELRIKSNSQCNLEDQLIRLKDQIYEYQNLPFPTRYLTIKEVFNILDKLGRSNSLGQFRDLFTQVLKFMEKSKKDIDRYIIDLPDYCVYERCHWEKELAFLRRIQGPEEFQMNTIDFYESMFKHLSDIKDIQIEHGNPIQAIEEDLNIADECMAVIPVVTEHPVTDYLRNKMQKHLNDACNDLEKFRKHPISNEYLVRIARYALFLDDQKGAKEYYDEFVSSGISINHYAGWIQNYFAELKREFG